VAFSASGVAAIQVTENTNTDRNAEILRIFFIYIMLVALHTLVIAGLTRNPSGGTMTSEDGFWLPPE
jgi:hypothetical protein